MRFDDGENKVLVIRKHWIVFFGNLLLAAFGAVLPIIILRILPAELFTSVLPGSSAGPVSAFLYFVWLLFLWLFLFALWTLYYLNVWIVTNRRIIDVDQKGLFSREIAAARIENVQDVTINTHGILQTLFDFGTLTIHTASGSPDFHISNAAHPNLVRQKILAIHDIAIAKREPNPLK